MTKPIDPKDSLPKVPPFYEKKKPPPRNGLDVRGLLSTSLMLVSWAALTVALTGGALVVFEILDSGLSEGDLEELIVKVIVLGMAYAFGWVIALVSIRGFGNLVYPIVIRIYTWVVLGGVGLLYLRAIYRLYRQFGDQDIWKFWAYVIILIGAILALIGLHLLVEGHDLRPLAIPLLIISVLQLFVIVFRYVYFAEDADHTKLWNDLTIFFLMVGIAGLMLAHIGLLSGVRAWIDRLFYRNGNGHSREHEAHWLH